MLRLAFSMLVATIAVALLAGAVINGRLKIPFSLPHPAAVAAAQEPAVISPPVVPVPASEPAPAPAPAPVDAVSNSDDESSDRIEIAPDRSGNFETDIEVHGRTIHVVVDTGASYFSLTADDAERLGFYLEPAEFKYGSSTANGIAYSAKVHISRIWIGNFEVDEVDAFVSRPGALQTSLLGMNVLRRLNVHISDGRLVLER
jgi:aspartyl protease family protein